MGGQEQDFTYGDCQKEMDMVNKAFIEIMIEGDANGRGFQYPIPTYSITKDFDWSETENNRLLFEMTAQVRHAVFLQLHQLRHGAQRRALACAAVCGWICASCGEKSGGFFGTGESTGSVGVVTINLPRIAYLWPRTRTSSTSGSTA